MICLTRYDQNLSIELLGHGKESKFLLSVMHCPLGTSPGFRAPCRVNRHLPGYTGTFPGIWALCRASRRLQGYMGALPCQQTPSRTNRLLFGYRGTLPCQQAPFLVYGHLAGL